MINGTVIDGNKSGEEKVPLRIHSDSSAARAIVARHGVGRLKHLAIRQLWLQDELRKGRINIEKIASLLPCCGCRCFACWPSARAAA
eukprot:5721679-Heterocapsa_arctica.AAC.1